MLLIVNLSRGALYEDIVSNLALAEKYRQYMLTNLNALSEEMLPLEEAIHKYTLNASSDMGNCTYIAPGIQALFSINASDNIHTVPFREAAGLEYAHDEALKAGKANAFLGLDVLLDDEFYGKVRGEWEGAMRDAGRL
jgi:hypothetical protein